MSERPLPSSPVEMIDLLRRLIHLRTGRQVRELHVESAGEGLRVRGVAPRYYVKQLVLAAVREVVGMAPVELDIEVR